MYEPGSDPVEIFHRRSGRYTMTLSVLVPTYRRPDDLRRCLLALSRQKRSADEVIVVRRNDDDETLLVLEEMRSILPQLRLVEVHVPGVVAAMNAGLAVARGDIIALTDDDAAPHCDWLKHIEAYFQAEPRLGAVGGRDWVHLDGRVEDGSQPVVGKMLWFGRVIGNHHLGVGPPREVDVLKGVNMSVRRQAIASLGFDSRLWGQGAQVHWELAMCLALKRAGWRLVYDPAMAVDHYPSVRLDQDQRRQFNFQAHIDKVHNETLILLEHMDMLQRLIFLVWSFLVGTSTGFGLAQYFRFLVRERDVATPKLLASLQGRWHGFRTWYAHREKPREIQAIHA